MKNVTVKNGKTLTVTKSEIRDYVTRERGFHYYSGLRGNLLAEAVLEYRHNVVGYNIEEKVNMIYDRIESVVNELLDKKREEEEETAFYLAEEENRQEEITKDTEYQLHLMQLEREREQDEAYYFKQKNN